MQITPYPHMQDDPAWCAEFAERSVLATQVASKMPLVHVTTQDGIRAWAGLGLRPPAVRRSRAAACVEQILGCGPCLYFFAGRVFPFPGLGGFAFSLETSAEEGKKGAASPFDTGGMLCHRIRFRGSSSAARRKQLLRELSKIPLAEWRGEFARFLAAYFDFQQHFSAYWSKKHSHRRADPDGILECEENSWQSRTFEVRLQFDDDTASLSVSSVAKWCGNKSQMIAIEWMYETSYTDDAQWQRLFQKRLPIPDEAEYASEMEKWVRDEVAR